MRTFGCQYWDSLSGSVRNPWGNKESTGGLVSKAKRSFSYMHFSHHLYLSRDGIYATSHMSVGWFFFNTRRMLIFSRECNLLLSLIVTWVQKSRRKNTPWSWRACNESKVFFFPVEVGANRGAKRATLDDWGELTRALLWDRHWFHCLSLPVCVVHGLQAAVCILQQNMLWGMSKPQHNPQGTWLSINTTF